jgi:acetyl esterase/lipase
MMNLEVSMTKQSLPLLLAIALVGAVVCHSALAEDNRSARIEPDVVYGHKDGLALTMDVYKPESEANGAAILFMVSGGWFSHWAPPEQAKPLFQPYLDKGYTVMAVRHGSSPRYSIPEAVADVRRAVRFVRKNAERFGVDPDRLGVLGMSAGGHLALMLGTTGDDGKPDAKDELGRVSSRVAAVVALVPPTDLRVAVWEAPESLPAYRMFPALNLPLKEAGENSPLVQVTEDDAPSLVIMGGKDNLVPAKHGQWIDEAFQKKGVQHKLIVFPDAGHGLEGPENRAALVRESIGWFDRYLKKRD